MKINKGKVLFFSSIGHEIGIGHVKRLQNLSEYNFFDDFEKKFYVLNIDKKFKKNILNINSKNNFKLFKIDNNYKFAFLDISNNFFLHNIKLTNNIIKVIRDSTNKLILIDGLKPYSIKTLLPKNFFDFIISPYLKDLKYTNPKFLYGRKYTILHKSFLNISSRKNYKKIAKNIILTFGGSDINKLNIKILHILDNIDFKLKITIVLGPLFSDKYAAFIRKFSIKSIHKFSFIINKINLLPIFKNSDLIFVGSGLTKYEVAASNTPQIIISDNKNDSYYNLPFKKNGLFILDLYRQNEEFNLKIIKNIILNPKFRKKIASSGKLYIDGKGAKRIFNKIK